MKILNWMQNKLNGRQEIRKSSPVSAKHHLLQEPRKDEFSDWPHALLSIGTFGNKVIEQDHDRINNEENPSSSSKDHLQKDVDRISSREQVSHESDQVENISEFSLCFELDSQVQHSTSVVLSGGKDVGLDNGNGSIGKKSVSFLLKKMFVCASGLAPTPSLRDPLTESRMEKILKAILDKKIYPQSSSSLGKKYLENKEMSSNGDKDKAHMGNDGCKWVKTDSEYIVLEI